MSFRRPIGIAGLITPFNFPLAIPTWKMFPALACGNAVIIKPSEDVPHTVTLLVEILSTRLLSVLTWYHLSFLAVSLAMLGMASGAVFVFRGRKDALTLSRSACRPG